MTKPRNRRLHTTVAEVEEFFRDFHSRFTSGTVTLLEWKRETELRMKTLYRHARKRGFAHFNSAAEALLEVYEHIQWHIGWREEGFKRLHGDNWRHPDKTTTKHRKETNK